MKKDFVRMLIVGGVAIVLAAALLSCQTAKPNTAGNSIQTEQTGLAPNGDKAHQTIDFALVFANRDAIKTWKVEMATGAGAQKQWSGDAKNLPSTMTWDGRSESGSPAPEGTYTAKLTVDYGSGTPAATAESGSFILDVSPPTGSVTFNPQQFTPDAQGAVQPVTVQIKGSSAVAKVDSWSLEITDPDGKSFRSFDGKWPASDINWDGKSSGGDVVSPGASYTATATLRDEFGLTAQITSPVAVAGAAPVTPGLAPRTLAVTPVTPGFSPVAGNVLNTEKLSLAYGASDAVKSWKLEVMDSSGGTQKTFTGDGSNLPKTVSWDGKNEGGTLAPEGSYTAKLSVDYGTAYAPGSNTSNSFVLDITPPSGSISLSTPLFSPTEGSPTISLTVNASSKLAKIDSWRMEIYDPDNHLFRTFTAKWPSQDAVWDGKGIRGDLVESAEDYPVVAKVRDEFGNVGELKSLVPVDILVEKTATGLRILSSRIFFKAYTADYHDVRADLASQNIKRLDALATKLKKFPNYKIKLEGHAVMIHWDNKALGDIEQREVLIPLSIARAEAIKKALVDRGLSDSMFTTEGVGASDQLVPDSNLIDRWQNRRVAFFLER
ncbi:MAG: FlgD immunoglobulin-like domain containing protein [Spirochaetia bacterium]|jgi:flagellar hook assembly protein FlgD